MKGVHTGGAEAACAPHLPRPKKDGENELCGSQEALGTTMERPL
jgi:hypothetical protein